MSDDAKQQNAVRDLIACLERMQGEVFTAGSRIQAINHSRVDDAGGFGDVIARMGDDVYLVRFDSMPGTPLRMAAVELREID